ncbi:MAG TPA: hypothetical protein VKK79_18685 [Candidatus Lokiarchaeia archaeon]|nr:hypothetical protein [Candidatus Lokiarchaeia archaeon]
MVESEDKETLWKVVKILPTDYADYGGEIKRWELDNEMYADCSSGCIHWVEIDNNWGVCAKEGGPRAGLLTWEHQAGYNCFESKEN